MRTFPPTKSQMTSCPMSASSISSPLLSRQLCYDSFKEIGLLRMWRNTRSGRFRCVSRGSRWPFRGSLSLRLRLVFAWRGWCLHWFLPSFCALSGYSTRLHTSFSLFKSSRGARHNWLLCAGGAFENCARFHCWDGFANIAVLPTTNSDGKQSGCAAYYFARLIDPFELLALGFQLQRLMSSIIRA